MSMNWMLKMSFDVSPQKRAHDSSIHHFHLMTSSGHNGWMITITPNELFRFTMTADELLFRTWDINRKESNQSFFVDLRGTPVKDQLSCSLCQTIQSSSQLDQALHSIEFCLCVLNAWTWAIWDRHCCFLLCPMEDACEEQWQRSFFVSLSSKPRKQLQALNMMGSGDLPRASPVQTFSARWLQRWKHHMPKGVFFVSNSFHNMGLGRLMPTWGQEHWCWRPWKHCVPLRRLQQSPWKT